MSGHPDCFDKEILGILGSPSGDVAKQLEDIAAARASYPVRLERRRAPKGFQADLALLKGRRRAGLPSDASVEEAKAALRKLAAVARRVLAWRRRCRTTDKLANALQLAEDPSYTSTASGSGAETRFRSALTSVSLHGCKLVLDGRPLPKEWAADPHRTGRHMRECSTTQLVGKTRGGDLRLLPLRCHQPLCPQCSETRREETVQSLVQQLQSYADRGCPIVHLTSTQRTRPGEAPVVLSDAEAEAYPDLLRAEPGGTGTATGGESLRTAIERFSHGLRAICQGSKTRRWWYDSVIAEIVGMEVTQFDQHGTLRWHVHAHRILVLNPNIDLVCLETKTPAGTVDELVAGDWWARFTEAWTRVADAGAQGQHATVLRPDSDLRRAVMHAIKYPCPMAQCTDAGAVEYLAASKGLRPHRVKGDLHARGVGARLRGLALWEVQQEHGKDPAPRLKEEFASAKVQSEILSAAGIHSGADVEQVRALVLDKRHASVMEAGVEAWRHRLLDPRPPGSAFAGLLVATAEDANGMRPGDPNWIRAMLGRADHLGPGALVTRARLAIWHRIKTRLCVAVLPQYLPSEELLRGYFVHGQHEPLDWRPFDVEAAAAALEIDTDWFKRKSGGAVFNAKKARLRCPLLGGIDQTVRPAFPKVVKGADGLIHFIRKDNAASTPPSEARTPPAVTSPPPLGPDKFQVAAYTQQDLWRRASAHDASVSAAAAP